MCQCLRMQGRFKECKAVATNLISEINAHNEVSRHHDLDKQLVEVLYCKHRIEVDHFDDVQSAL